MEELLADCKIHHTVIVSRIERVDSYNNIFIVYQCLDCEKEFRVKVRYE